jgi:NADH-ubiquinone reductase complex 1 MLRQ subunit
MNSLRPAIQRVTVAAMRRGKATLAPQQGVHNLPPQTAIPPYLKMKMTNGTFKENWLSDPSTYPIIVIMGCALTFMTGMGFHALAYYKDVRINPAKKHSEIQTWGREKVTPIVAVIGDKNPYYKVAFYEGLGINHEEWLKQKEASDRAQRS